MSTTPRPRDPIWEALVDELGEPATRSERGRRNRVVKELREVGATPDDVHARCDAARRTWGVPLTDTALSANWTRLGAAAAQPGRGALRSDLAAFARGADA